MTYTGTMTRSELTSRWSVARKSRVAAAMMTSVSQPTVPAWTWVRIWLRSNSTASAPLRMPMTMFTTNTAIATR